MDIKKLIKKIMTNACVYFSIVTAIYSLVMLIITVDDDTILIDASRVLLFFVASVVFAIAGGILKLTVLKAPIRFVAHFLTCCLAVYACMFLPLNMSSQNIAVGLALFTVIYLIVMSLRALFLSKLRSNLEKSEEYEKQFKSKK